jgi:tetratricopeptide (TPR) repeat protein
MRTEALRIRPLAVAASLSCLAPARAADDFKVEYDKGVASYSAGDYPAALAHFERAYGVKPHPLCLFNMGQAHRKMDHLDEAIAAYERFLATKPAAAPTRSAPSPRSSTAPVSPTSVPATR